MGRQERSDPVPPVVGGSDAITGPVDREEAVSGVVVPVELELLAVLPQQAFQFVDTGNAEVGFVALSQLSERQGSRWVVPQDLYAPIRQNAVLLKRGEANEAAKAFLAAYSAKYNSLPSSIWPVLAGDAFNVIVEAIKAKGADSAAIAEYLIRRSVWIIGGDGWAYDIGFGGLDHVLSSGEDVNILVLDTEVYSNTGGQNSKATPRGAVAKFAAGGQPNRKKDLARIAMDYENVFVAKVAYGAKDTHTLKAFLDAESYPGVSLIIAYSPCIAHGVDMSHNHRQQDLAVKSGHWPLLRYDPRLRDQGKHPMSVDSAAPSIPFREFARNEARFTVLERQNPEAAERFMVQAESDARLRHQEYVELAELALPEAVIKEKAEEDGASKENSNA